MFTIFLFRSGFYSEYLHPCQRYISKHNLKAPKYCLITVICSLFAAVDVISMKMSARNWANLLYFYASKQNVCGRSSVWHKCFQYGRSVEGSRIRSAEHNLTSIVAIWGRKKKREFKATPAGRWRKSSLVCENNMLSSPLPLTQQVGVCTHGFSEGRVVMRQCAFALTVNRLAHRTYTSLDFCNKRWQKTWQKDREED